MKDKLTKLSSYDDIFGDEQRLKNQEAILENTPLLPLPVGYSDIDSAMFNFLEEKVDIVANERLVPTYTLFSNQRFSEYTQMWEHSDEEGNPLLNFKTINREKNPNHGTQHNKLYNIPTNRRATILRRETIDETGIEHYEFYTMKQPYNVDLIYKVSFITNKVELLNTFNQKLNKIFASRQYYIKPNGHHIPVVVDNIADETAYNISERKFYVQTATLKVMAYIIDKEDFDIVKVPKRTNIQVDERERRKNAEVDIDEVDSPVSNKNLHLTIKIKPFKTKVEFDLDTDMNVEEVATSNVRTYRTMINDTLYYTDKGFKIKDGDNIRIVVTPLEPNKETLIKFIGYDPSEYSVGDQVTEELEIGE